MVSVLGLILAVGVPGPLGLLGSGLMPLGKGVGLVMIEEGTGVGVIAEGIMEGMGLTLGPLG